MPFEMADKFAREIVTVICLEVVKIKVRLKSRNKSK